jgi:DNA-binding transcriptional LysR family regulator
MKGMLRGSLTVGASTIPASHLLPAALAKFHALHPAIRLRLVTGDSEEVLDRLLHGDVEVAVVGTEPQDAGLRNHPVGEDSLVLVVPPGHPLAQKKSVGLEEVAAHALVLREPGSGTRRAVMAALARALGKTAAAALPVACEAGSNEMLKALVRGGLGAAFTSRLSVKEEVASGALVVVPVRGFAVRRTFRLVTRKDDHLSPAARAFTRLVEGVRGG